MPVFHPRDRYPLLLAARQMGGPVPGPARAPTASRTSGRARRRTPGLMVKLTTAQCVDDTVEGVGAVDVRGLNEGGHGPPAASGIWEGAAVLDLFEAGDDDATTDGEVPLHGRLVRSDRKRHGGRLSGSPFAVDQHDIAAAAAEQPPTECG